MQERATPAPDDEQAGGDACGLGERSRVTAPTHVAVAVMLAAALLSGCNGDPGTTASPSSSGAYSPSPDPDPSPGSSADVSTRPPASTRSPTSRPTPSKSSRTSPVPSSADPYSAAIEVWETFNAAQSYDYAHGLKVESALRYTTEPVSSAVRSGYRAVRKTGKSVVGKAVLAYTKGVSARPGRVTLRSCLDGRNFHFVGERPKVPYVLFTVQVPRVGGRWLVQGMQTQAVPGC